MSKIAARLQRTLAKASRGEVISMHFYRSRLS
jgi:hypothetical protein